MSMSHPPNDLYNTSQPDSSDGTLSTSGVGGPAAGQIGPYRLLRVIGESGRVELTLAAKVTRRFDRRVQGPRFLRVPFWNASPCDVFPKPGANHE